jgi:hypothetical protein
MQLCWTVSRKRRYLIQYCARYGVKELSAFHPTNLVLWLIEASCAKVPEPPSSLPSPGTFQVFLLRPEERVQVPWVNLDHRGSVASWQLDGSFGYGESLLPRHRSYGETIWKRTPCFALGSFASQS